MRGDRTSVTLKPEATPDSMGGFRALAGGCVLLNAIVLDSTLAEVTSIAGGGSLTVEAAGTRIA